MKFPQSEINASDFVWSTIKSINIWFKIILLIRCDLFHDFPFQYRGLRAIYVRTEYNKNLNTMQKIHDRFFLFLVKSLYFMFSIFTQPSLSYSVWSK